MKNMKKILLVAVIALIAVVCTSSVVSAGFFDFLGSNAGDDSEGEVNLAAAASLKNVYDEKLIPMFNEKYPNIKVTPTYASSGDLQTQIENGLEADIFMSASNKQMNALADEDLIDNSTNVFVEIKFNIMHTNSNIVSISIELFNSSIKTLIKIFRTSIAKVRRV